MNFSISILDIVIFLGILQAVAAIVIIRVSKNNIVSRLFCFLLLVFILICFKIQVHTLNIWKIPGFTYFPLAIDLLLQPTFYLYFLSVSRPNFRWNRKYMLHFVPCMLLMVHAIIVYLAVVGINDPNLKTIRAEKFAYNAVKLFEDYLSIISSFLYCYLAYAALRRSKLETAKNDMPRNEARERWLLSLVILFLILSVILAVNVTLENIFKVGERTFLYWTIFYAYLSCFLYYLSITSIRLPELTIVPITLNGKKLDKEKTLSLAEKLQELVEKEKLYRNPDLSIHDLARRLNTNASTLSYVINSHFNNTFRDFINDYKVRDVKEMLRNNSNPNLSILGIALEAGFSSEASFYRIFKSKVGMSPKEFREKQVKG